MPLPAGVYEDGWAPPQWVRGIDDVRQALEEVEASCRTSVDIFVPGVSRLTTAEAAERRLLARGRACRCLYEREFAQSPDGALYMEEWAALGEQQHVVAKVPVRGAIVDQEIVLVPIEQEGDDIKSVLLVRSELAAALALVFELLWVSRDAPIERPSRPFLVEELAVLRLMCQGLSDRQIARELGISERTVQRRVHSASRNLRATSRASLAAHAVALGLVDISPR